MSKNLLTKKGYTKLRVEFDNLSLKERPKVVHGVATAAAEGDRSENAEYIYGKKRLREIDKRLGYLSRLLKNPQIINSQQVNTQQVSFGCRVCVINSQGEEKFWTIVGEGEADYKSQTISTHAPVAKALLGKQIGDIAEVNLAHGVVEYEVTKICVGDID